MIWFIYQFDIFEVCIVRKMVKFWVYLLDIFYSKWNWKNCKNDVESERREKNNFFLLVIYQEYVKIRLNSLFDRNKDFQIKQNFPVKIIFQYATETILNLIESIVFYVLVTRSNLRFNREQNERR